MTDTQHCACGVRLAAECTGPYNPGCDLGTTGTDILPLRLDRHDRRYGPGPGARTEPIRLTATTRGEILGEGNPDWPEDLMTSAERAAYQRGIADERARLRALSPTAWMHKVGLWLALRPPRDAAELAQWQPLIPPP